MNSLDPETVISDALAATFSGQTERDSIIQTSIPYEISIFRNKKFTVVDKWVGGADLTVGQEIVLFNGKPIFARNYAGGTVNKTIQTIQELTSDRVIKFLTTILNENADTTRLGTDLNIERDLWKYEYICTGSEQDLGITTGEERIYFDNKVVFVHFITFLPLEA